METPEAQRRQFQSVHSVSWCRNCGVCSPDCLCPFSARQHAQRLFSSCLLDNSTSQWFNYLCIYLVSIITEPMAHKGAYMISRHTSPVCCPSSVRHIFKLATSHLKPGGRLFPYFAYSMVYTSRGGGGG